MVATHLLILLITPTIAIMRLTSIRALVTRPMEQAEPLAEAIRAHQGYAGILPMLVIQPLTETPFMRDTILSLDQYEKVIVTSHHGAAYGLEKIDNYWPQLPVRQTWFAIGRKTAKTLSCFDVSPQSPGDSASSEGLLALESLNNVSGQRILIIKGEGGLTLLEDTLSERGASVSTLAVYCRQCPDYPEHTLENCLKDDVINTILCASGETLSNLMTLAGKTPLKHYDLVVPSERVAELAYNAPFRQIIIASGASNDAMLSALETLELQKK